MSRRRPLGIPAIIAAGIRRAEKERRAAVNGGSISRFGSYVPPTAGQRAAVIAERIEAHNSAAVWRKQPQQSAMELI